VDQFEVSASRYDARLAGVVVRFGGTFHGMANPPIGKVMPPGLLELGEVDPVVADPKNGWKLRVPPIQPPQGVRLTPGRLHVLLGRNGSGKTRLLRGLLRARDPGASFPSATLILDLPDETAYSDWVADVREEHGERFLEYAEAWDRRYLFLVPRVMSTLRDALLGFGHDDHHDELGMTADEALRHFGFDITEIKAWRSKAFLHEQIKSEYGEIDPGPPSWTIRDLAPGLLLRGSQLLPHNKGYESIFRGPHTEILPSGEWINDSSLSSLVGPAIHELLNTATRIELVDQDHFRFLAPRPDYGPLKVLLTHRDSVQGKKDETYARASFPLGLVESAEISGIPYAASFPIPIPIHSQGLVGIVDISPQSDVGRQLEEVVGSLAGMFLQFSLRDSGSAASIEVVGLHNFRDAITQVAEVLKRCEIGIGDLSVEWPPNDGNTWQVKGDACWQPSGIPSVVPSLLWTDASSGTRLRLHQASEGQQHVIALFLRIAQVRAKGHGAQVILLGDEIDRCLHPSASTQVLSELSNELAGLPGVACIVSTHNIASLSGPVLRGAKRVLARRSPEGFQYSSASKLTLDEMMEVLGSTFLDVYKLKRLFVLVEGEHDEIVMRNLLKDQIPEIPDIEIANGNSPQARNGIFANMLRFLDSPVLVVHDKRNRELEDNWSALRARFAKDGTLPEWRFTELRKMQLDVKTRRKEKKKRRGDDELETLLYLLQNNVFAEGSEHQAGRLSIFGLECTDIADLLPIQSFPLAHKNHDSWEAAHQEFSGTGEEFKSKYGIYSSSIEKALEDSDSIHDELVRLLRHVRELLTQ